MTLPKTEHELLEADFDDREGLTCSTCEGTGLDLAGDLDCLACDGAGTAP